MNPGNVSVTQVSEDPAYKRIASQSFDVYPGWAEMHVYQHVGTGELWAANVYMSDDDSTVGRPTAWFRVRTETKIVYVKEDQ